MTPDAPTYDDLVRDLTREHPVLVETDDGLESTDVPGLITQLREEIHGGSDRGAASGNKTRLPLNAPALDMFTLIDRQVSELWSAAFARVPGVEKTETLLAIWSAHVDPFAIVRYSTPETILRNGFETVIWTLNEATPYTVMQMWVRQIEDLFDPPRIVPGNPAACVQCGARDSYQRRDGQVVRSTALALVLDRRTDRPKEVRCQACGKSWGPELFEWLNQAILDNEKRTSTVVDK